ncbi:unnamed protein product (macronuclear) [Paramecium tetraurelia]|uniref:Uncharacterized protein n=1 Tax=Paramecium tetraurelia TaxID=5888 RepID=A0DHX5_PARTE|nr:uncharacterized protein GSPATT00017013001 [Paramecium tetraurelia]CAK82642.1 unnamed protein product [Paramecium tetraurelia]|eukprot:XP_001450039.1 hypothetical protein (macronuclear) [Paramecium tetraurelia strain d4-2]
MFNEFEFTLINLLNVKEFLEFLQESGLDIKIHKNRMENLKMWNVSQQSK